LGTVTTGLTGPDGGGKRLGRLGVPDRLDLRPNEKPGAIGDTGLRKPSGHRGHVSPWGGISTRIRAAQPAPRTKTAVSGALSKPVFEPSGRHACFLPYLAGCDRIQSPSLAGIHNTKIFCVQSDAATVRFVPRNFFLSDKFAEIAWFRDASPTFPLVARRLLHCFSRNFVGGGAIIGIRQTVEARRIELLPLSVPIEGR